MRGQQRGDFAGGGRKEKASQGKEEMLGNGEKREHQGLGLREEEKN